MIKDQLLLSYLRHLGLIIGYRSIATKHKQTVGSELSCSAAKFVCLVVDSHIVRPWTLIEYHSGTVSLLYDLGMKALCLCKADFQRERAGLRSLLSFLTVPLSFPHRLE